MRHILRIGLAAGLVTLGLVGGLVFGLAARPAAKAQLAKGDDPKPSPDETAVHKALKDFVTAFNAGDVKKLAATLTETNENPLRIAIGGQSVYRRIAPQESRMVTQQSKSFTGKKTRPSPSALADSLICEQSASTSL